jgi:Xaa-Pro aminopeptidase
VGFVTRRSTYLITDGRYAEQARDQVPGWKTFIAHDSLFEEIRSQNLLRYGWRIGFDGNTLTYAQFKYLKKIFPKVKFLPKVETIEKIAAVKDAGEIERIRQAVRITDQVFTEILPLIKPGVTELDIAAEISYRQRKHGAEADAFEAIVASGERSSLPHGRATAKKLATGELVTLDFGCIFEGYHSDMTRTLALGKPKADAKTIYGVVLDAQRKAIEAARSGMKTKDLDAIARGVIKQHGFDKFYRHSLGHGIGLQIHEPPRISVLSTSILGSGNVVTIEPGIYIPHLGGVRIEDDIVITNGNCEVLNRSSKELIVL